jgi:hypothetical protein
MSKGDYVLTPHRVDVIQKFRDGLALSAIGKLFGVGSTAVRNFLMRETPIEYDKLQTERCGTKRLRPNRKRDTETQAGYLFQCTNLPTCRCPVCQKRNQTFVPYDGERYRVIKGYGVQAR